MLTSLDKDPQAHELSETEFTELRRLMDHSLDSGSDAETESPVRPLLSFVIPVKDEEETIVELYNRIAAHVPDTHDFEVVFIDDGSSDGSWPLISLLATRYSAQVRGIRFRGNAGKAAALSAGFRAARGQIIFTMDGDLQDDPSEIPRFLEKLEEGYGLVSGWKKVRHDPWHKVLPSRVFNWMLSLVGGVKLHDHNCGFKCYRADLARQLTLHGELHRMVPSLSAIKGYSSAEIVVQHHPRQFGSSKYGIERFLRGFSDMLTIGFLRRFRERPSHCINGIAAMFIAVGVGFGIVGAWAGLTGGSGLAAMLAAAAYIGLAVVLFVGGLMSELIIRGGLEHQWRLPILEDTAFVSHSSSNLNFATQRPLKPIPQDYRACETPSVG